MSQISPVKHTLSSTVIHLHISYSNLHPIILLILILQQFLIRDFKDLSNPQVNLVQPLLELQPLLLPQPDLLEPGVQLVLLLVGFPEELLTSFPSNSVDQFLPLITGPHSTSISNQNQSQTKPNQIKTHITIIKPTKTKPKIKAKSNKKLNQTQTKIKIKINAKPN